MTWSEYRKILYSSWFRIPCHRGISTSAKTSSVRGRSIRLRRLTSEPRAHVQARRRPRNLAAERAVETTTFRLEIGVERMLVWGSYERQTWTDTNCSPRSPRIIDMSIQHLVFRGVSRIASLAASRSSGRVSVTRSDLTHSVIFENLLSSPDPPRESS